MMILLTVSFYRILDKILDKILGRQKLVWHNPDM